MTEDAFNELCAAAEQFKAALYKFQRLRSMKRVQLRVVVLCSRRALRRDPKTVGIVEFGEHIDTVLCDIREDFYAAEEE